MSKLKTDDSKSKSISSPELESTNTKSNFMETKKFKSIIENKDDTEHTKQFKRLLNLYLENLPRFNDTNIPEFEVRFGTRKIQSISKIDFHNVIKSLLNYNFKLANENYQLKIIPDNEFSKLRTQISGFPNIQYYCKNNNLSGIEDLNNLQYVEKNYFKYQDKEIRPVDFDHFNFRVAFQVEKHYNSNDQTIVNINNKWNTTKKVFRYIKRFEYTHPELPFLVHCSIVKTSKSHNNKYIPQFNIKDSKVFDSIEHFEIEIELNNTLIAINSSYDRGVILYDKLKQVIKYILIGLQQSNFPIAIPEQTSVINNYLQIVKGQNYDIDRKVNVKDFIGPSSSTLQMINLLQKSDINDTNNTVPNIRENYTVTDKADGMRKLLFIDSDGKIYLIPMSMNIQFTGTVTENEDLFNTIIDGEHILHNKNGEFINLYAAFDIYFINKKNITGLPFINVDNKEEKKEEKESKKETNTSNFRLVLLNTVIKTLKILSIIPNTKPNFQISIKKFFANNIFNGCATILDKIEKGLYEYNTDGLIFTPANTGVANKKIGFAAPNYKVTWNESFKWKPPQYNTIDFLVKFEKNEYNVNKLGNIHNDGINMKSNNQIQNYLTLVLNVGFDPKKHGYINPFNDVINDYLIRKDDSNESNKNNYKPARFYPTNPSDENAGITNIIGKLDESNNLKIYTEDGQEIEDNTIVEFRYDSNKPEFWKWIPIRVRDDKTSELRSGVKNFGNAYHVANSNWQSIHNPITEKIIKSGEHINVENGDDDVYYNKVNTHSETRSLRDFHNLYVKNILLNKLSSIGNSLIDYACGKGGDLPKWIGANLDFVLGIDLSKDNIENRIDGACARYLNYVKKYSTVPKALFINGNSSINIKNGEAFNNDKNKQIIKALFGEGTKNEVTLGKGVYKNYGIAKNGFNISSIQFALHYMFENEIILNEFLKNIAQCTALEGYFVGTCYDGNKVFNMLNNTSINESVSLFKNNKKIWQITKKYSNEFYNDDESSIGYAIDVYQETINKTFREYLVNFKYLKRVLENYGFVLLTDDEVKQLDMPSSIGSFEQLYNFMKFETNKDKRLSNRIGNALNMSSEEKRISFLNNYFIFKKIRNVDVENMEPLKNIEPATEIEVDKDIQNISETIDSIEQQKIKDKSKKLAEKYVDSLSEIADNSIQNSSTKIKLDIDAKIKLAAEKKKERDALKLKEKEEKKAKKLAEKEAKKKAKSTTKK